MSKKPAKAKKARAKKPPAKPAAPKNATKRGPRRSGKPVVRRRRSLAVLHFFVYWGMVATVWAVIFIAGMLVWYATDLPDVDKITQAAPQPTVTLVSRDGRPIARFGNLYGTAVPLANLPSHLPKAVIATEDRRFYSHFGLDIIGLGRAMYANIKAGRIVQGGSTISQQLAKNLFLTPVRTIKRKAQEVILALWLEYLYSKDEILALYLNRVYLGSGTYGVEAAAQKYFNKSARKVTLAEAAMLAGLLKAPSRYAPTRDLKAAQRRSKVVLGNMVAAELLAPAVAEKAVKNPAKLRPGPPGQRQSRYFADWVLSRITDYVGRAESDLTVITTLDTRLQGLARQYVQSGLNRDGRKLNAGQAALVAMTPSGAIRAMIGGGNYDQSQFNRATRAKRQPGSAFKPIIYLAGLEAGLRPDSHFTDKPVKYGDWAPKNYSGRYRGDVTMATALALSINTVAAQVMKKAGTKRVRDVAFRLGIASPIPAHLSVSLGVAEVSLLELTTSYAAFASEGRAAIAHGIAEIRDKGGRILYRRSGGGGIMAMSAKAAAEMNQMLQDVIRRGTGKAARLDRPAAGKTGTSQDYRDAWFVGYTKDYVTGVWFGNDDGAPMKRVTGGGLPARTWRAFMLAAHKGVRAKSFAVPPSDFKSFLDRLFDNLGKDGKAGGGAAGDKDPTFKDRVEP